MREETTHAIDAFFEGIVGGGHGGYGACFCHTIANGEFSEVEDLVEFAHQLCRDTGASCDSGTEMFEAGVGYGAVLEEFELCEKHGGDTIKGGAFLFLYTFERGIGLECFGWEDDGGAVGGCCHVA